MFRDDLDPFVGMGYWTRSNSEFCLLGTRGKPKRLNADVRQAIIEPRREHSRKPDCVYNRIERLVAGPYLELFARTTRPGWTSWGNQVGKFAEVAA
jgi:N6-adenosine-specific RNA methylase IME4